MEEGLKGLKKLYSAEAVVIAGAVVFVLLLVLGLSAPRGMTDSPFFTGALLFFAFLCALRGVADICGLSLRKLPRAMFHVSVALILTASLLGRGAKELVTVNAPAGELVTTGLDGNGKTVHIPFGILLKDFSVDYYPGADPKPKSFISSVDIVLPGGEARSAEISVNHPFKLGAWRILQYSFDKERGSRPRTSVLLCVRDPWYPAIAAGLWLMLLSVLAVIFVSRPKNKWFVFVSALITILFIIITGLRINFLDHTPVPALQSRWFFPHIGVYMLAYALLTVSTAYAIYLILRNSRKSVPESGDSGLKAVVRIGWALLTAGMITGAFWAKEAWGDWWNWDPKETWAAATWMCYMIWIHGRNLFRNRKVWLALLVLAFLMLQMCWWGVDYLPSAREISVHTY